MLWQATYAAALAIVQFWMLLCHSQKQKARQRLLQKQMERLSAKKHTARTPSRLLMDGPVHVWNRMDAVQLCPHSSVVRAPPFSCRKFHGSIILDRHSHVSNSFTAKLGTLCGGWFVAERHDFTACRAAPLKVRLYFIAAMQVHSLLGTDARQ
jgi:hypothetical protein